MNFLEGIITGRAAVEAPADTAAGASANSRMSAPARLHQPDGDGTSDNEVDAAAEAAVLQVEADLQDAFEKMHDVEERLSSTEPEAKTPSAALLKFNASISTVVKKNKVVRAFGKKHFEQEGSDALLFDSVPAWIKFTRISGYRYRLVRSITPRRTLLPRTPGPPPLSLAFLPFCALTARCLSCVSGCSVALVCLAADVDPRSRRRVRALHLRHHLLRHTRRLRMGR